MSIIHQGELNNDLPPPDFFSLQNHFSANPDAAKEPDEKNDLVLSGDVRGHILPVCKTANEANVCHYCPLLKRQRFFLTNHTQQAAIMHHLLLMGTQACNKLNFILLMNLILVAWHDRAFLC